jgi:O-Antigen ligase
VIDLRAAATVLGLLTAWRPVWGLAVLLVALPLATHHPSALPTFWLVILVTVFEGAYVLRVRPSLMGALAAIGREPLLLLSVLFAAAAISSLSSLPVLELWREHLAVARLEPPSAWPARVADVIRLPETRPEFPIVAAFLTLQSVALALIVWREARASSRSAIHLCLALILGLVGMVGLGLAEAAGGLDLSPLRGAEFMASRAGTLQAAAGNPGWFAEYVVYVLPYSLGFLGIGISARAGLLPMLATLALGLFSLGTAFQRGGWVAGSVVTAFVIWASFRLLANGRHDRASKVWHVLGTLAVAGMLTAVTWVGIRTWVSADPGAGRPNAAAFLARFTSIASGDRLVYWRVGREMLALHPVLGAAHESFALRYSMYYQSEGGALQASPDRVPDAASGHSLYVQTATGTGVVGLALLVGLLGATAWAVAAGVGDPTLDRRRLAPLLAGAGSVLGVATYGLVQEVFYVHALRVVFFVGVGLVAGTAPSRPWSPTIVRVLWLGLALALAVHLVYEYRWPGPNRLFASPHPTGVGGEEQSPSGETFRWTTIVATWPVPEGASRLAVRLRSVAPFAQTVEVTPCRGPRVRVTLDDQSWRSLEAGIAGCAPGDRVWLRASPGWRPGGNGGLLGVMVSDLRFE